MSQIRAFLAIDVDEDLKPKIYKLIKEFKNINTRIKYVELENLHLTLKFFGEIDTEGLNLIEEAISKVVSDFEPFKIRISGCGAFPNTNRIKVIWVGIDGDEIIRDLHDKLDKEFARLGFDKDKRFSTHLTIGRMKSGKNKNFVKSTIDENSNILIGDMEVTEIKLKKSTLTPAGPIYEDISIFEL